MYTRGLARGLKCVYKGPRGLKCVYKGLRGLKCVYKGPS